MYPKLSKGMLSVEDLNKMEEKVKEQFYAPQNGQPQQQFNQCTQCQQPQGQQSQPQQPQNGQPQDRLLGVAANKMMDRLLECSRKRKKKIQLEQNSDSQPQDFSTWLVCEQLRRQRSFEPIITDPIQQYAEYLKYLKKYLPKGPIDNIKKLSTLQDYYFNILKCIPKNAHCYQDLKLCFMNSLLDENETEVEDITRLFLLDSCVKDSDSIEIMCNFIQDKTVEELKYYSNKWEFIERNLNESYTSVISDWNVNNIIIKFFNYNPDRVDCLLKFLETFEVRIEDYFYRNPEKRKELLNYFSMEGINQDKSKLFMEKIGLKQEPIPIIPTMQYQTIGWFNSQTRYTQTQQFNSQTVQVDDIIEKFYYQRALNFNIQQSEQSILFPPSTIDDVDQQTKDQFFNRVYAVKLKIEKKLKTEQGQLSEIWKEQLKKVIEQSEKIMKNINEYQQINIDGLSETLHKWEKYFDSCQQTDQIDQGIKETNQYIQIQQSKGLQ